MNLLEKNIKDINSKKISYLRVDEGANRIRLWTMDGEHYKVHYDQIKKRYSKCPEQNCPLCQIKNRSKNQYILPVIERRGNTIGVLDFGDQVLKEFQRLHIEIATKDPADLIYNYDLILMKGPKNSNPMYTVELKQNMKGTERFKLDQVLKDNNKINLKDYIHKTEEELERVEKKKPETESKYDPNIDYK